ncbi:MAG: ABC transporter ATP-binding protein/permease [Bacteroidetes bacterium]|nr:ABC transporter ATP-binding protein/permease [Bacteroidota bacterium]
MSKNQSAPEILISLKPYLVRYRKKLILGLLFVFLTNLFNVTGPILVAGAVDSLKLNPTSGALLGYGLVILFVAAGRGIFLYLVRQTIIVVSREAEFDIRNDLYQHLQTLSASFYKSHNTGDLLAKNTNDINAVRSFLGPGIMYSANTLVSFFFIIPVMLWINWKLTLLVLVPLPVMSYLVFRMGKLIHQVYSDIQGHYSVLTTRVQENLSGIRIVKSFVRESAEIRRFTELNGIYQDKNLKLAWYQSFFYASMTLLIGLSVVLVVWAGGALVISGALTIGQMTQFVMYIGMLIWPMVALGWVMNIIQQAAASQKRLNQLTDETPEISDSSATDHQLTGISGKLEFKSVSYTYPDGRKALENINFSVDPGEILAITGHTGSGKSTLAGLIVRLFDPTSGVILLDGRDLKSYPLKVLRSKTGYVPQESFLFSDTIGNNIAFGVESAGDQDVLEASETALIRENIEGFPNRFETVVGERGITLSGGQKQRTSIARALMKNPDILILDDSLSAVDTQTEDAILTRLREKLAGKTVILISHRISAIKSADQIVVLSHGQVAEIGKHSELVDHGGLYSALYVRQLLEEELKAIS